MKDGPPGSLRSWPGLDRRPPKVGGRQGPSCKNRRAKMNGSAKLRQQSAFWCACTHARGEARDKQKPSKYQHADVRNWMCVRANHEWHAGTRYEACGPRATQTSTGASSQVNVVR
eukprot:1176026-Amphidinium_carterae.1